MAARSRRALMLRLRPLIPAVLVALVATALATGATQGRSPAAPAVEVRWTSADGTSVANSTGLKGLVQLPAGAPTQFTVDLRGGYFTAIPKPCRNSSTIRKRTRISNDGSRLTCWLPRSTTTRRADLTVLVAGEEGAPVTARVLVKDRPAALFPELAITKAPAFPKPDLRLLSTPDFLNADIGDLRKSKTLARPRGRLNSTNPDYERALKTVLDDFSSTDPDAVLVAGDLVDGLWGDPRDTSGIFGANYTDKQRRRTIKRAAATYYPQWIQRFAARNLSVLPAVGDHEYGDDPWKGYKRKLAGPYRAEFAKYFTTDDRGRSRFASRPTGQASQTAYAGRLNADTQLITLDVFDITRKKARISLDNKQLRWVEQVLAKAKRDRVKWIIVQGHTPILGPTRLRGSTGLRYQGGSDSALWKLFKKYGVDLYLAGEVHDITAIERDGITQITHGGSFQYGLTNYLLLDFYRDFIYINARDFDMEYQLGKPSQRVWETRRGGNPARLKVQPKSFTVGTAQLSSNGNLRSKTGLMKPWSGGFN